MKSRHSKYTGSSGRFGEGPDISSRLFIFFDFGERAHMFRNDNLV